MTYFYVERDVRLPMESYIVAGFKDIIAMETNIIPESMTLCLRGLYRVLSQFHWRLVGTVCRRRLKLNKTRL